MDAQYFIDKFSKIPDNEWTVGNYESDDGTKHCALGHCGCTVEKNSVEAIYLTEIVKGTVSLINDGKHNKYNQATPKERILAALHDAIKPVKAR